ncbi:MAG: hypothetical protein GF347_04655 [Candidatus Moranbacteria bacterium]|nr:hypothetical protein [Candidatus Moranbacteria bacterium]
MIQEGIRDPTKIEIELIALNKLADYAAGKSQSAVEAFIVDVNSDNFEQIGESSDLNMSGVFSKIKESITGEDPGSADGLVRAKEDLAFEDQNKKGFLGRMLQKVGLGDQGAQSEEAMDSSVTQIKPSKDALKGDFASANQAQQVPPGVQPQSLGMQQIQPPAQPLGQPQNGSKITQRPTPGVQKIPVTDSTPAAPPSFSSKPPAGFSPQAGMKTSPAPAPSAPSPPSPSAAQPQAQPKLRPLKPDVSKSTLPQPEKTAPSVTPPQSQNKTIIKPYVPKPQPSPDKASTSSFGTTQAQEKKKSGGGLIDAMVVVGRTLRFHLKTIFILIVMAGIVVAFFALPKLTNQPKKSSVDIVVEYSNLVFKRVKNSFAALFKPGVQTNPTDFELSALLVENKDHIDLGSMSLGSALERALDKDQIAQISVSRNQLGAGAMGGAFDRAWLEIKGEETPLKPSYVYQFADEYRYDFEQKRIYFLKITDSEGRKIPFSDFVSGMRMDQMPAFKKDVRDYHLMIFIEDKGEALNSKDYIRLGLVLLFDPKNQPSMAQLKDWENKMIGHLLNFYTSKNTELIDPQKQFATSSISSNRRYLNFTEDHSLSLDYGLTQDGMFIVTSRNFGEILMTILIQNN